MRILSTFNTLSQCPANGCLNIFNYCSVSNKRLKFFNEFIAHWFFLCLCLRQNFGWVTIVAKTKYRLRYSTEIVFHKNMFWNIQYDHCWWDKFCGAESIASNVQLFYWKINKHAIVTWNMKLRTRNCHSRYQQKPFILCFKQIIVTTDNFVSRYFSKFLAANHIRIWIICLGISITKIKINIQIQFISLATKSTNETVVLLFSFALQLQYILYRHATDNYRLYLYICRTTNQTLENLKINNSWKFEKWFMDILNKLLFYKHEYLSMVHLKFWITFKSIVQVLQIHFQHSKIIMSNASICVSFFTICTRFTQRSQKLLFDDSIQNWSNQLTFEHFTDISDIYVFFKWLSDC